jgi:hypothetical protein
MNRKQEVKTGIGSSKMLLNEHRKVLLWLQSGDIIHAIDRSSDDSIEG